MSVRPCVVGRISISAEWRLPVAISAGEEFGAIARREALLGASHPFAMRPLRPCPRSAAHVRVFTSSAPLMAPQWQVQQQDVVTRGHHHHQQQQQQSGADELIQKYSLLLEMRLNRSIRCQLLKLSKSQHTLCKDQGWKIAVFIIYHI